MTKGKLQLEENNNFNGMTKATSTTDVKTGFFLKLFTDLLYKFSMPKVY